MLVYFDSSALVKTVLDEGGRQVVLDLLDIAVLQGTARVTYPECHAAVAAAHQQGRLDDEARDTAVAGLRMLDTAMNVIDLDQTIAFSAGKLAQRHGLRGYDAVHLAAGLTMKIDERPVIFATWDRRLHQAAFDAGFIPAPAVI